MLKSNFSLNPIYAITASFTVLSVLTCMIIPTIDIANASTYSINKVQSGLVVSDSLTTGTTTNLNFGGTASSYNYYEDSQGLHVGVQSSQSGQWVNYYAGLPQSNAHLFHTTITIPDTTIPDGVSNVGLYVEGSDYIPHVACEAYADSTGYYWDVEQSSDAGATYNILYISQPSSMPQTQDCTIITNGSNYLKVYIGGKVVFSSNSMNLGMSTPFIAFVQDDTSSSSSMNYAIYRDYYGTSDENIKVINNPSNAATVKISDSSGQVLASSPVASGIATLDVGMYNFPLISTINIYDSSNSLIATSSSSMYGGDVFSVTTSAGPPTIPTGLIAIAISSSQINLSWTIPNDDGGSPITGYKIERAVGGGAFSVLVANTGSTGTTYSDTGLAGSTTYTYRVSAINSVGTSSPSNTASATTSASTSKLTVNTQDLSGIPISGLYIELWKNGVQVDGGFSPVTFTLNNGQQYIVTCDNYQNYVFNQWSDNSISPSKTITPSRDTSLIAYYQTGPTSTSPQPPTGLAATAVSSSQINLSWTAPSDNGGSVITGYKVDRSTNNGTTWNAIVPNTSNTGTTYSDTGLSSNTTYTYRVSAINAAGTSNPSNAASATTFVLVHSITQIQSGLAAHDPLNNETKTQQELQTNSKYWKYGGDAPDRGAPYIFSRDNNGLHIGVQAPANGSWAGFYSVSPDSNAMLYHAVITTPINTISAQNQYYENGMYIQTSQPFINYVTCSSITGSFGTVWAVVSSLGNATQGNQFKTLWYDTDSSQPLTRDCTIITNGTNYLKVYMDGVPVYENKTMNLQMASPFNTYLEPQTSYADQMLVGSYLDYYATTNENLKVTNLPSNSARIDLTDASGNIISSMPVSSSASMLDIGKYHFPLIAEIKVYDSNNIVIASTSNPVNIFGGDTYSIK